MPLDIPALTRGISGLFTAKETGKREAEDRAREQQRQVMADLLGKRRVDEFVESGKARRQQQAAAAEERKLRKGELETQREAALRFINDQLPEDQKVDPAGMGSERAVEEAERRRNTIQRRTEADAASARITGRQRPQQTDEEKRQEDIRAVAEKLVTAGEFATFGEALEAAQGRANTADRFFQTGSLTEPLRPLERQARQALIAVFQQKLAAASGNQEGEQDILDKFREALKQLPSESDEGLQRFLQRVQGESTGGAGGTF